MMFILSFTAVFAILLPDYFIDEVILPRINDNIQENSIFYSEILR
jgi:hypothetical protein